MKSLVFLLSGGCENRRRWWELGEKRRSYLGFKNQIKHLKFGDCYLEISLYRTAHLEDKGDDVEDDDNNSGVLDREQIHQWLQDSRLDKLYQLVHGAPSCEVSHCPDSLFLDFKFSLQENVGILYRS